MKKLFTFMLLSVFAFASSAQITELWNFSVAAGNQQNSGDYDKNGIAISNDGTHLYRATRTANSVGVFKASDGSFVKNLTGMTAGYGGDVAVDNNGAIYASNVIISGTGELIVGKWANENASFVKFISTTNHGGNNTNRIGYGMDVFVDENGDGFLIMHKNATTDLLYWEISNNAVVSQTPATVAISASPVLNTQYARIQIVDKDHFWLDGTVTLGVYCTITRTETTYSTPTSISGVRNNVAGTNVDAGGTTEFTLSGIRYGVFAANNHSVAGSWATKPGHYTVLQQLNETGASVTGSVIAAELPTGGMGKTTDASHFVESVVHVADNFAYIYSMGGLNGTAAAKVEAAKLTTLIPAAGSHEGTSLEITLTAGTAGADLYYTTNGTTPTNASTKYTAPFTIGQGTTTVKVLAVKSGLLSSVTTAVYTVAPPEASEKTFTVTVPAGTEKVYVVGSFSGKNWDISNPHELIATGNPNEYSGSFPCVDGVEYKYLNGKANWNFAEAKANGEDLVIWEGKPASAIDRSYNAADVVKYWVASPKVNLTVTISENSGEPSDLFVKGGWNGWTDAVALSKQSEKVFTGSIGNGTSDVIYSNTEYKYLTSQLGPDNWEERNDNRWMIYPAMNDEISKFETEIPFTTVENIKSDIKIMRTSTGISVELDGNANSIELYNMKGVLMERAQASGSYTRDLESGAYILRINGVGHKFVR